MHVRKSMVKNTVLNVKLIVKCMCCLKATRVIGFSTKQNKAHIFAVHNRVILVNNIDFRK